MMNHTLEEAIVPPTSANEFYSFGKVARLNRPVVVTEKIDGTNAQILITSEGEMLTGSRNRWITPEKDNFGFARWAQEHKEELLTLGPGRHFGEWWGHGIQRGYGLQERRFSLFNVKKFVLYGEQPLFIGDTDNLQTELPPCVGLVPVITEIPYFESMIFTLHSIMQGLQSGGSLAAPGFMNPEGIVIFHAQGNVLFKKTFDKDETGKGQENS